MKKLLLVIACSYAAFVDAGITKSSNTKAKTPTTPSKEIVEASVVPPSQCNIKYSDRRSNDRRGLRDRRQKTAEKMNNLEVNANPEGIIKASVVQSFNHQRACSQRNKQRAQARFNKKQGLTGYVQEGGPLSPVKTAYIQQQKKQKVGGEAVIFNNYNSNEFDGRDYSAVVGKKDFHGNSVESFTDEVILDLNCLKNPEIFPSFDNLETQKNLALAQQNK